MKKVLLITLLLGLIFQVARPATDNSAVIGSWKCVVNDIPPEYNNSTITIALKEGKLAGSVRFENGSEIRIDTIKYVNNLLTLSMYVDGNPIKVDGKVEGPKITGSVDVPDGKVTFVATRIIEIPK